MRRGLILTAWLLLAASQAVAAVTPKPGAVDPRIRTVVYDPDQVVALTGYFGYQMMIEFNPSERIENVSIGDGLAWQITPNKKANVLFLKPMQHNATTNMTVITDRRRYAFELRARRTLQPDAPQMAYVVRFAYPQDVVVATVTPPPAPPPPEPERRNTAYSYTGSRASLPSEVFDDGQFTYFRWSEGTATPALFLLAADGGESVANYAVRNGYLVVEQLAPRFVLRDGKDVTTIINDGWREPTPGALAPRPHDAKTAQDAARAEGAH